LLCFSSYPVTYMYVCMCPSKGRQGENHISTFSKLSKGRDDEFLFFFFIFL
jgi:hypothetical protein